MPEMTINSNDISIYNARLQTFSVSGTTLTNSVSDAGSLLKMPTLYSCDLSTRQLSVTVTFFPHLNGENSRQISVAEKLKIAAENIARFEAEICGKIVEIALPDGFIYTSLVQTVSAASFDASGEHDVTYTFICVRHKPQVSETVSPNGYITCRATTAVPCKIIVDFTADYTAVTIMGIVIKNITSGDQLIIDSENGIITCNGINKFNDTDFTEFIRLNPGQNKISSSCISCTIKVVYTPLYI